MLAITKKAMRKTEFLIAAKEDFCGVGGCPAIELHSAF
jgi:hypothetical protein